MWRAGTQERSSGPYPSQSTRYCRPLPRRLERRSRRTVNAGPPSMTRAGGGGQVEGTSAQAWTGFSLET